MRTGRLGEHLVVLLTYTVMLSVFTWPILSRVTTHLAGAPGDNWVFYWNLWWFREALFEQHVSPFYTNYLFHPVGVDLAFHTTTLLNTLPGAVAALVFPLPVVYNGLVFANFVFAAFFMHVLVVEALTNTAVARHDATGQRWRWNALAGFAGVAYSMAPFHVAHLGHLNILTVWPLPFLAWRVLLLAREPSARQAAWTGAALGLCGLADPYHLVTGTLLAALVWILCRSQFGASRRATAPSNAAASQQVRSRAIQLATLAAVFLFVLAPVWAPVLQYGSDGLETVQAAGSDEYVADVLSYVLPSAFHPLWADAVLPAYRKLTGNLAENVVFPTYTVLILAFLALRRKTPQARSWGIVALVFVVLSLGPFLHVGGRSAIRTDSGPLTTLRVPLPKVLLDQMPLLSGARSASRFAAAGQLALVLMATLSLAGNGAPARPSQPNPRRQRRRVAPGGRRVKQSQAIPSNTAVAVAFTAVVFECWAAPMPTTLIDIPEPYRVLQREVEARTDAGPLLEIPPVHAGAKVYQLYQSVHGMPLFGGHLARGRADKYDHLYRDPLVGRVQEHRRFERDDGLISLDGLERWGVRYVMVHGDPTVARVLERAYERIAGDENIQLMRRREPTVD